MEVFRNGFHFFYDGPSWCLGLTHLGDHKLGFIWFIEYFAPLSYGWFCCSTEPSSNLEVLTPENRLWASPGSWDVWAMVSHSDCTRLLVASIWHKAPLGFKSSVPYRWRQLVPAFKSCLPLEYNSRWWPMGKCVWTASKSMCMSKGDVGFNI